MIDLIVSWFAQIQGWIFETLVQPVLFYAGLGNVTEEAFEGLEWLMIGLLELLAIYAILRPLEAWIPVKRDLDPGARRIDFIYTCVHRLGAFSILIFFLLDPLFDGFASDLRMVGLQPFNLDHVWPGVTDIPIVSFMLYLIALDFFDYWYHRASHRFNWWWGLHSLHHSQRDMNLWSDNRNHLLDDLLRDVYMATVALAIGVEPAQYVPLIALSRMLQSLQHANVRLHFGRIGERILVSPRYHRLHHAIGIGHESAGRNTLGGHNFAVLFPVWDMLFKTARFGQHFAATGVRDQLPAPDGSGRDYGRGFWRQQWLGLQRMREFARRPLR